MLQKTPTYNTYKSKRYTVPRIIERNSKKEQREFIRAKQVQNLYATSKQLFLELVKEIPFEKHSFPFSENQSKQAVIMLLNFIEANNLKLTLSNYKLRQLRKDYDLFLGTLIDFLNKEQIVINLEVSNQGTIKTSFSKEVVPSITMIYCLSTAWLSDMSMPIRKAYANLLYQPLFRENGNQTFETFDDEEFVSDYLGKPIEDIKGEKEKYKQTQKEIETLAKEYSYEELKNFQPENDVEKHVQKQLLEFNYEVINSVYSDTRSYESEIMMDGGIELAEMFFTYIENNVFAEVHLRDINSKASEIGLCYPAIEVEYNSIEDCESFEKKEEKKIKELDEFMNSLDKLCSTVYNCYKNV